mmetsp:Transcript_18681/g.37887  ORF Transcript_18681/g.37887 Transcript_18681/m.37887 type:complete len:136 (-) Transcript_18681:302-709(-)|eukprot:CAMPEP_0183291646 /NCGR_PEP_ID=MMETSP0160_2-20130417/993_1 /TAXON_ID=2839 ORGANISM="Odontella Sinensis, Strain Grunow 1884" /NCGR_SAMPLE_ID=MMETSP0160_2 /ASSEMBLY_ACC=CAM_ASM_000250 /LENGTH=135 /DNA_ID=CAMNT_0025452481 /DNA_START=38 /DNA_END=445 /DNA_ORIENTATION=+
MATRGLRQLKVLRFTYCERSGSSASMREYISSGKIVEYARSHPDVTVVTRLRNGYGRHPFVLAEYRTGCSKQIGVKNESVRRIEKVVEMLTNTSGRKIKKLGGPVRTQTPSVQGIWTPMLDIAGDEFNIELVADE